jgi:F0F1-type ATP synthase assembly protein I
MYSIELGTHVLLPLVSFCLCVCVYVCMCVCVYVVCFLFGLGFCAVNHAQFSSLIVNHRFRSSTTAESRVPFRDGVGIFTRRATPLPDRVRDTG